MQTKKSRLNLDAMMLIRKVIAGILNTVNLCMRHLVRDYSTPPILPPVYPARFVLCCQISRCKLTCNYMDHYSFTNPRGMEGCVVVAGWPIVDTLPTSGNTSTIDRA